MLFLEDPQRQEEHYPLGMGEDVSRAECHGVYHNFILTRGK